MSQQVRVFLTAIEFIEWINNTYPKSADDGRTDVQYALWAVCLQEAHALSDSATTKDIADLFLNGSPAMAKDPIQSIQDWLDTVNVNLAEGFASGEIELSAIDSGFITQEDAETFNVMNVAAAIAVDYSH